MMAKYRMRAETGKLGMANKQDVQEVKIDGQDVVAGVVVIHNMMVQFARQLGESQQVLSQLVAAADHDANWVETSLDIEQLEQLLADNEELLRQVHVK
jgi:hypothetical protein